MATAGSVMFAWRSDTTSAYYAPGGEIPALYAQTPGLPNNATIIPYATTGCIGGAVLDLFENGAGAGQWIRWNGIKNTPEHFAETDGGVTILVRGFFPAGDTPPFNNSFMNFGGYSNGFWANIALSQQPAGQWVQEIRNEIGQGMISGSTISTSFGLTSTIAYDMVVRVANTATGTFSIMLNGSTVASVGQLRGYVSNIFPKLRWPMFSFGLGTYLAATVSDFLANELVFWDRYLSDASITSIFTGPSRTSFYDAGGTLPKVQPFQQADPGIANVADGTEYIVNGNTLTGTFTFPVSTDPGVENVAIGTGYTLNDASLTGTLVVPVASTGPAGTVPLNELKEQIRYVLFVNNTSTGAPSLDLSEGLSRRVKTVLKINPDRFGAPDDNAIPAVTVFTDNKEVEQVTIAQTQLQGKRRAIVNLKVMGMVWEPHTSNLKTDPADEECEKLMENIERIIRAYDTLGGNVQWHIPTNVTYHSFTNSEETHFRAGVLDLLATIYY